jgi:hypothetical protein
VLRGMGLAYLSKNEQAIKELTECRIVELLNRRVISTSDDPRPNPL